MHQLMSVCTPSSYVGQGCMPPSSNHVYLGQTALSINEIAALSGIIHDVYRLCIDDPEETTWLTVFSLRIELGLQSYTVSPDLSGPLVLNMDLTCVDHWY